MSIGNFDGVHRGHAELIAAARAAVGTGGQVIALSFDPHPASVLRPEVAPRRLSSFDQRTKWLQEAGADRVVRLTPTPDLLGLSPREFIVQVVERHHPDCFVEGPDFCFGRGRSGTIDTLRAFEPEFGYRTVIVDSVVGTLADLSVVRVSSTLLRWLIERGRVTDAERLLGRPYEMRCAVVKGDQRGRTINMPTANLDHQDLVLPADGIYAGTGTAPDGRTYPAAISVGTKPTFGSNPRTCEAHLIGYDGPLDLYGWTISLRITRWLRDQIKYAGIDGLMNQLERDVEHALAVTGAFMAAGCTHG